MNEERTIELLASQEVQVQRSTACPSSETLADYCLGSLAPSERIELQAHVFDCGYCLDWIGRSVRGQRVATSSLSTGRRQPTARRFIYPGGLATAAVLMLTVGIFFAQPPEDRAEFSEHLVGGETTPTTRAQSRFVPNQRNTLNILAPLEGAEVDTTHFTIEWSEVPESLFYELRIVADDGAVVMLERTSNQRWDSRDVEFLVPGATFFVRVNAYFDEVKPVASEHVMFTVRKPED